MSQLLSIVKECDLFPYEQDLKPSHYLLKTHDGRATIGHIIPTVATELLDKFPDFLTLKPSKELWINPKLSTESLRSTKIAEVASQLRQTHIEQFPTLKGWRAELYTAYYPNHTKYFQIERAFAPLLGIVMYGVHINGYIPASEEEGLKLWIPRRSIHKPTFPGMLDNTIAGGLGGGLDPLETAVKESYEEAGIEQSYIRHNLKQVGSVSYIYICQDEGGLIQPEIQYVYDLKFTKEMIPTPIDGEVQEFYLMPLGEVLQKLNNREFKPNCALVVIDFLIRHGFITAENEADYLEIVHRLHRNVGLPTR
ncbi:hypothetical protein WICPIJ_001494 [Wickerhamomyces pijperi]|uniref:Nudix hydrolase domain-containing protein n=1 Tax=Wickerhamomyces pijperi TaxID=599730 RepID=A0A9P8QBI4_WICPI|nr:hypothetical protein WICPIJ_001494 [Wickerhamomyces pijperi]